MKTFKQFIKEDQQFDLEKFKSDCSFFLGLLKGTKGKYLTYRGGKDWPDDWAIRSWKPRTQPRNTPIEAHNIINDYFEETYGEKFRNWMFFTPDRFQADIYSGYHGSVSVIFPIGQFEWACSANENARDLTQWLNDIADKIKHADIERNLSFGERYELAAKDVIKKLKQSDFLHNALFRQCLLYDHEIMFKCEKYYTFNFDGITFNSTEFQDFLRTI